MLKLSVAAAGGVTGAGFITIFSMSNDTINIENESFNRHIYNLSDMGNFTSIGLMYSYPDYYYREGYDVVGLYDIVDNYIY